MAKFFMTWEVDRSKLSNDPKAVAAGWHGLLGLVKQDLETGSMKDWGAFPGSGCGYCIAEGSNVEVMAMTMRYTPFVIFDTRAVATAKEVNEVLAAASK